VEEVRVLCGPLSACDLIRSALQKESKPASEAYHFLHDGKSKDARLPVRRQATNGR
jgi:hypothetical protein